MIAGDLAYIPSHTYLYEIDDKEDICDCERLEKPTNALVVEASLKNSKEYYKILYKGKEWYVNCQDVYEVNNE